MPMRVRSAHNLLLSPGEGRNGQNLVCRRTLHYGISYVITVATLLPDRELEKGSRRL